MRILCFFLFVLAACKTPSRELTVVADSSATSSAASETTTASPDTEVVKVTFRISDNALSYKAGVRPNAAFFNDSTHHSASRYPTEDFLPVMIASKTTLPYGQSQSICERFYWYEVVTDESETGWVYGADLLQDYDHGAMAGNLFQIGSEEFQLLYLTDLGVGPSDDSGLTGCNQYIIPYVYNEKTSTYHFIRASAEYDQETFLHSYYGWLSFISSEGGGIDITSISYDDESATITMMLSVHYQDGGIDVRATLTKDGDDFVLNNAEIWDSDFYSH